MRDDLAASDARVEIGIQRLDHPGNLTADGDVRDGVERAGRSDKLGDLTSRDGGGLKLWGLVFVVFPIPEALRKIIKPGRCAQTA